MESYDRVYQMINMLQLFFFCSVFYENRCSHFHLWTSRLPECIRALFNALARRKDKHLYRYNLRLMYRFFCVVIVLFFFKKKKKKKKKRNDTVELGV
jgi:hypothetical protein